MNDVPTWKPTTKILKDAGDDVPPLELPCMFPENERRAEATKNADGVSILELPVMRFDEPHR